MIVAISRTVERQIFAHCAESSEIEACGLLFGDESCISRAIETRNVSATPRDSFEIDPAALFAAIRAERDGGERLIGHYHSHPTGAAEPSARDAAQALDVGKLWLIVAGQEMQLWRANRPGELTSVELALASQSGKGH